MDYLRFGKAQVGFVCLLFSPWRHITQALLSMNLLLSMTSPHSWPTRLRTPFFVYQNPFHLRKVTMYVLSFAAFF